MAKHDTKKFFLTIILLFLLAFPFISSAQVINDEAGTDIGSQADALKGKAGFADIADNGGGIGMIIAGVINAFFSILAVIFIVYIILAGYNWMTAQGDDDKIKNSKETIRNAIIGLIIIVAAYSITYFVFDSMDKINGGGGGYVGGSP